MDAHIDTLIRGRSKRSAFTLVEVVVCLTLLAVIMGVVGAFQLSSQRAVRTEVTRADIEMRSRRTMQLALRELTGVASTMLTPDPSTAFGTDTITYQKPVGVDNVGNILWSNLNRLALQMDAGETDNGLDDDGDGLVDERRLVLTRDVGLTSQRQVTVCHGIPELQAGELPNGTDDNGNGVRDERGFNVFRVGDRLSILVSVEQVGDQDAVLTWDSNSAMTLRN